jgi:hypothetical protein
MPKEEIMGNCSVNVTPEMLVKYPELAEAGFADGDKISIGKPLDGIVEGGAKLAGKCENSCSITVPRVDGARPGWQSEFVAEFFPAELASLEGRKVPFDLPTCYNDPIKDHTSSIAMQYLDDKSYDSIERYMGGTATLNDLTAIKGSLDTALARADSDGWNPVQVRTYAKLIDVEIAKAKRNDVAAKEK